MTKWKPALAGLTAILIVAFVALFPPARAVASDFLGLFRVQKFAPISVSPQQLQALEAIASEGLYPGEFTMQQEPKPFESFGDIGLALQSVQATAPRFRYLNATGALGAPNQIGIESGGQATLVVDLKGARGILDAAGVDPLLLPDSLDGAEVSARIYNQLVLEWDDLTFVQMPGPDINYPADVNPAVIGEALLRFLGMDEAEAYRLANSIDWTTTMVMPIPVELATFAEVRVDETNGLAIESVSEDATVLLWQQGETVYLFGGAGYSIDDLIDLVGRMSPRYY